MRNTITVLLLAVLASGCATGRLADLKQCGRLSLGAGVGLSADVKLGMVSHPSVGLISCTQRIGTDPMVDGFRWRENDICFPLTLIGAESQHGFNGWGLNTVYLRGYGPAKGSWGIGRGTDTTGNLLPVFDPHRLRKDGTWFNSLTDLQVGATVGVVSFGAGLNPLEIIDFLLGCVGIDIAGDDPTEKEEKPTRDSTVPSEAAPSDVQ